MCAAGVTGYMSWPATQNPLTRNTEAALGGLGKGEQIFDQTTRGRELEKANTPKVWRD